MADLKRTFSDLAAPSKLHQSLEGPVILEGLVMQRDVSVVTQGNDKTQGSVVNSDSVQWDGEFECGKREKCETRGNVTTQLLDLR